MKKYLLKETKRKGATYDDKYSTYKNPDTKLKQEIKSFKADPNKVTLGWPEQEWTIVAYEGEEVKCQRGKNTSYFPIEEVKEAQQENEHYQRNQKFQPHRYFTKHFGVLTHMQVYEKSLYISMINLSDGINKGSLVGIERELDPTVVEFYGDFYKWDIQYRKDDHIKIEAGKSYRSMNLYFDKDGNYVNRNYNENLNNYVAHSELQPTAVAVDHIEKLLKSFGKTLLHCKGKYYTDKVCLVPYVYKEEFGVEIYPSTDEGRTYKKYRHPQIKRPKSVEEVPYNHLVYSVMKLIPENMKLMFVKLPVKEAVEA